MLRQMNQALPESRVMEGPGEIDRVPTEQCANSEECRFVLFARYI